MLVSSCVYPKKKKKMSYELPVTYLQTVPLPQLPLSTAGLPSQATGVSHVPLTVMAVAHVFLIPEYERPSRSLASPSSSNAAAEITNDEPVSKRKRVTLIIDPIASYTKDLDVAVARCVAASGVSSLRFQNEHALNGLRTSLHPLDIIVSHSTPADCIRVLPCILPWYRAASNVVAATDNAQGWKAVVTKVGLPPPLPATFKLQHEMPQDRTWYVAPYFSVTPPDDAEQASQEWFQLAMNATSPARVAGGSSSTSVVVDPSSSLSAYYSSRPPLATQNQNQQSEIAAASSFFSSSSAIYGNHVLSPVRLPAAMATNAATQGDIAWMLPHAKKDGGASERAAAALLTHERHKGEIAASQLEAVKTSLEAVKASSKSQKIALESENGKLQKRVADLENDLRHLRIERVATADNMQQLHYALTSSKAENANIQDSYRRQQDGLLVDGPDSAKLTPELLMVSRPESLVGPIPTSLQNAGPSDAEVLAALMIQASLKPTQQQQQQHQQNIRSSTSSNNNPSHANMFQSASASPLTSASRNLHHHRDHLPSRAMTNQVGTRGPSPISSAKKSVRDPNNVSSLSEADIASTRPAPPSPLVVNSELPIDLPVERPPWSNILGDTPQERNLDPYGLTNSATAFTDHGRREHATLVRNLLVKNAMPSPMEKLSEAAAGGGGGGGNNYATGSGYSSRSSTPTRSLMDQPTTATTTSGGGSSAKNTNKIGFQHETTSANYRQQANRNIRSAGGAGGGTPRSRDTANNNNNNSISYASLGRNQIQQQQQQSQRDASPVLMADPGRVQATTASLYNLSNHIKAGRKLIQELRS